MIRIILAAMLAAGSAFAEAVHPDVLNIQDSFAKVAEQVEPAVVSITTTRVEQIQQMPQFFFGDPFEQFFGEEGTPGAPYRRPRGARQFKMEGMGSGVRKPSTRRSWSGAYIEE